MVREELGFRRRSAGEMVSTLEVFLWYRQFLESLNSRLRVKMVGEMFLAWPVLCQALSVASAEKFRDLDLQVTIRTNVTVRKGCFCVSIFTVKHGL